MNLDFVLSRSEYAPASSKFPATLETPIAVVLGGPVRPLFAGFAARSVKSGMELKVVDPDFATSVQQLTADTKTPELGSKWIFGISKSIPSTMNRGTSRSKPEAKSLGSAQV